MRALFRIRSGILPLLSGLAVPGMPMAAVADDFRPTFHFVTEKNWMNEPNGLIRIGPLWHLFYQTNPTGINFANLSWGHATSTNLIDWRHHPVALPHADGVLSFSGTTAFDGSNSSGLGTVRNPPYLAFFTGYRPSNGVQDQRLAYSLDLGVTWLKWRGNPIISQIQEAPHDVTGGLETRDPKVFFHAQTDQWIMLLSHGGQNKLSFWTSPDAKEWKWRSDFGTADVPGIPDGITGWEVADLFELPIAGEAGQKWVLLVTPARGSPAGGNGVIGILGDFKGTVFTADPVNAESLWLDRGRDFDGVTSWENVPESDGRRIIAGVMNSYGSSMPSTKWKGLLSFPRTLELHRIGGVLRLTQQPVAELDTAGSPLETVEKTTLTPGEELFTSIRGRALDIRLDFRPEPGATLVLEVRKAGTQKTSISYRLSDMRLSVDRSASGNTGYHPDAGGIHSATFRPESDGGVRLRILVDGCALEVFGGRGEAVISNLIFPDSASDGISLRCSGADVVVDSAEVRAVGR